MLIPNMPKKLAIIPARGTSKGVVRKNIRPLFGKPLIVYSIEQTLKSKHLTKIIVSTEDEEIAEIAKGCGIEVPFLRPPELARDDTPTLSVLQHAVRFLEEHQGYRADIIVTLQPTSPLRTASHIDEAIEQLINTNADSVVSLCVAEHSPYWMKKIEGDRVIPFLEGGERYTRRQDLPKVYRLNGAVYVTRYDVLMMQNRVLGNDTRAIIMSQEDSIDIDTEYDLKLAELILQQRGGHE